jgi:hypothetical protein
MQRKSLPSLLAAPLSLLLGATGVGCGGDDDDNPVDYDATPRADAEPDDDAQIVEPTCAGELDCNEGGEVRLEYVTYTNPPGPGGRNNGARVTAFLLSNAGTGNDPDRQELVIDPEAGGCYDVSERDFWPAAQSADREYVDAGQFVITGGPLALSVEEGAAPPTKDTWQREHADWGWHFGIDDAATYISGDTAHSVTMTGSDTFDEHHYADAIYVPASFAQDSLDPPGGGLPIELTPGEDMTFTHEVVASDTTAPVIDAIAFVVAGVAQEVCLEIQDDGEIVVPASVIDHVLSVGAAGTMSRQTFTHNIADMEVDGNHRRIDMIGVWCYVTPWTAPPP